jgi:hypothetical protein
MEPRLIPMGITNTLFMGTALFCALVELSMQHRFDQKSIPPHLKVVTNGSDVHGTYDRCRRRTQQEPLAIDRASLDRPNHFRSGTLPSPLRAAMGDGNAS